MIIILGLSGFGFYLLKNRKNIHVVNGYENQPEIYRSAQLKVKDLEKLLKSKGIDMVLNLRGESAEEWYLQEKALLEELGVEYYSYGFSVYRTPDKKRFLDILDVLDKVKAENKKLLIHCKAGADRTGLVSSIAQIVLYGYETEDAWDESLTWLYGHVPVEHGPLEQILDNYEDYQDEMSFRDWVINEYSRKEILIHAAEHKAIPKHRYTQAYYKKHPEEKE
ncbi:MAG: tyrosine-protein phosphatase [Candidatus Caenarcaniphilales bacterium]|nr:tyrosine-protein phosphatase [Candidatus Caenarcaniphilales bacterium]